MNQRSISFEDVENTIANNEPFEYFHNGYYKKGYYDPNTQIFVAEADGQIITVIDNVELQYIDNLKSLKP